MLLLLCGASPCFGRPSETCPRPAGTAALCRFALSSGASPDLAAALPGVTHAKLFLAGQGVREGMAVQELVEKASTAGVSVVLPSGQGLSLVAAAPAVPL